MTTRSQSESEQTFTGIPDIQPNSQPADIAPQSVQLSVQQSITAHQTVIRAEIYHPLNIHAAPFISVPPLVQPHSRETLGREDIVIEEHTTSGRSE